MFRKVGLQIVPEVLSQRIFGRRFRIQHVQQCFHSRTEFRELELRVLSESNEEYTLPVLWDNSSGIDNFNVQVVAQLPLQGVDDRLERPALVVTFQIPYVFEQKSSRPLSLQDSNDLKKQSPLGLVLEAMFIAQRGVLGDPRYAEWLAREPPDQNIVIGDYAGINFSNVPFGYFSKVRFISLAGEFVPLAGKHASTTGRFETKTRAANASKQVDKSEIRCFWQNE